MTNEQIAIDLCSVHHMTGDSGQLCHHCERIKDVLDERDADHRRSEAAFIELVNEKDSEIAKLTKERDEANTVLEAWFKIFGTTQLSHAEARLEAAESRVSRLEAERDSIAVENKTVSGFIRMALDELGVPNEDYPEPVSNAVKILNDALAFRSVKPCG